VTEGNPTRPPGRQARRQNRGTWFALALLTLMAAFLFGIAVWELGWQPGGVSSGTAAGVAAFMSALGALVLGLAWYAWRKVRPPKLKHVRLSVTPTELRRGGRVQATVELSGSPRAGAELELALVCTERYDVKKRVINPNGADYDQRVTRSEDVHREVASVDASRTGATFEVPADLPFSYEGDCISAAWHVHLIERRPRARDRSLDEPVWVLP
jgi:hypothetical protein